MKRIRNIILKSKGGIFLDGSANNVNSFLIRVLEACVFTTLDEKNDLSDVDTDVMASTNLIGKTIPAGASITPGKKMFSNVTITSGKIWIYTFFDNVIEIFIGITVDTTLITADTTLLTADNQ